MLATLRQDWLGNVRNDLLAGMVVPLALIPEAIAISIIAGVDPKVGLYASFSIAIIISFAGGLPASELLPAAEMAALEERFPVDYYAYRARIWREDAEPAQPALAERLAEGDSYTTELSGQAKRKERLSDLAKILGIARKTLHEKIKLYDITTR